LRDVTLNLLDVSADNGADEAAAAIVDVDVRNNLTASLIRALRALT
jgi:hypothetical protein